MPYRVTRHEEPEKKPKKPVSNPQGRLSSFGIWHGVIIAIIVALILGYFFLLPMFRSVDKLGNPEPKESSSLHGLPPDVPQSMVVKGGGTVATARLVV
ncbi:MAG: hypothetical protein NTV06_10330 [candidate division Zixibacteria bacterium]|nr:hypothetical protein [candidate division Zixibacteria bacterium]